MQGHIPKAALVYMAFRLDMQQEEVIHDSQYAWDIKQSLRHKKMTLEPSRYRHKKMTIEPSRYHQKMTIEPSRCHLRKNLLILVIICI